MIYKLSLNTLGMSMYVSLSWNCYKKTVPTPACIPEFFDQDGIMIVQLFFSVPFLLFFGLYDWFVEDDVVIGTLNEVPFWWMYFFLCFIMSPVEHRNRKAKKNYRTVGVSDPMLKYFADRSGVRMADHNTQWPYICKRSVNRKCKMPPRKCVDAFVTWHNVGWIDVSHIQYLA